MPPKPPPITAPKLNHPTEPLGAIEAPAGTRSVRMEICGPDGQPRTVTVTDPIMFDMSAENYDRWKVALSNSPNASAHVLGLMFQWLDAHESLDADTSLEQLIDLATTTRNPDAYAAALSLCKTGFANEATLPACRRLSLSEWTKLDLDNALPWLASAAEARNNGDSWAESVAFARASQAHRLDDYAQSSLSAALTSIPPDTPRTEQLFARTRLFGIRRRGHASTSQRPRSIAPRPPSSSPRCTTNVTR